MKKLLSYTFKSPIAEEILVYVSYYTQYTCMQKMFSMWRYGV